jgi:NAD(P)-dependent dehydrogenase (short-subunit alcohol dehydrogenase family)
VAFPGDAAVFPCDVTDPAAVDGLVEGVVDRLGSIDVLVNNAGATYVASVAMSKHEPWLESFAANVFATYYCSKAVLRRMIRARSGRIINLSSVAAKAGAAHASSYASSKAAVLGLTKSLARETARLGITVNAICPWHVDTELMRQAMQSRGKMFGKSADEYIEEIVRESPQRRLIRAEEVAALAVFLASPLAGGINGQSINICGGAHPE